VSDQPPIGKRFSHNYLKRGDPGADSVRMRRRMASLIYSIEELGDFSGTVSRELGVDVPWNYVADWPSFFQTCELQDVLDLVTVAYRFLKGKEAKGLRDWRAPDRWTQEVQRIFTEENLHYRVDDKGGVHFSFDAEFAFNTAAALASLRSDRFRNARASYEGAMAELAKAPPNGKDAIRGIFACAEGIFRLMFADSPRLTAQEVQKMEPYLQKLHAGDAVAIGSALKLINAFKDWIDAAHFYRHEAGKEEQHQPPIRLAVLAVSMGASFIRWLAEIDASIRQ
jgi:hypothetical protein